MELDALCQAVRDNLQSAGAPLVEIYQGKPRRDTVNDIALFAAPDETFQIARMGIEGDTNASHPKYAIARAAAEPKPFKAPKARWVINPQTSRIVESPDGVADDILVQYAVMLHANDWTNWRKFIGIPNAGQLWGVEAVQLTGRGVDGLTAEHLTMLAMDLYHDRSKDRCVEYFVSVE